MKKYQFYMIQTDYGEPVEIFRTFEAAYKDAKRMNEASFYVKYPETSPIDGIWFEGDEGKFERVSLSEYIEKVEVPQAKIDELRKRIEIQADESIKRDENMQGGQELHYISGYNFSAYLTRENKEAYVNESLARGLEAISYRWKE